MLIKYSGKYVKIYFNMKITCFQVLVVVTGTFIHKLSESDKMAFTQRVC